MSRTLLRSDAFLMIFVSGSIGYATCWGPPSGRSSGVMICPSLSPNGKTKRSPFCGWAIRGSSARAGTASRNEKHNPRPRAFRTARRPCGRDALMPCEGSQHEVLRVGLTLPLLVPDLIAPSLNDYLLGL